MTVATQKTADAIQGCKLAYVQSDEASFLLTDFDDLNISA
jgi:tRNA(His) 5'-end guanylyltransferase